MVSKFPFILIIQIVLLILDVIFNGVSVILYGKYTILLLLYILQDTFLIIALLILLVSFTATIVFQIGLINQVFKLFLPSVVLSISYIFLSMSWHYTSLSTSWDTPGANIYDSKWMVAFYVIHKFVACLYYSRYKRAALQISDPKLHSNSKWLREQFKTNTNEPEKTN